MTGWFGRDWGAPVCRESSAVPTPIGQACAHCGEKVAAGEDGFMLGHWGQEVAGEAPLHLECYLRLILGGVNHLRGTCLCCGGTEPPDPPGISRRAAARLAAQFREEVG